MTGTSDAPVQDSGRVMTPSPSILIDLPNLAQVNEHHQQQISTPNRARSLSPSALSTTSAPSSPSNSHHPQPGSATTTTTPAAGSSLSALSPRPSMHFATTRPSPVVPASPSLSRPGSPKFGRSASVSRHHDDAAAAGPSSPTSRSPPKDDHLASSISRSNSAVDLTHIFERDVEFNATHTISPQEAVDVAIPPVLDEAAAVITASQELNSTDLSAIVNDSEDGVGSGWQSPSLHAQLAQGPPPVRSPKSRNARSFSPDSSSSVRAASPGSTASFSVATPGSSPPNAHPFTQHLNEALEVEALRSSKLAPSPAASNSTTAAQAPPSSSEALLNTSSSPASGIASPAPLVPLFSSALMSSASPAPASPSIESSLNEPRRLSFVSYADLINEERLAELTGSPIATQTPTGAISPTATGLMTTGTSTTAGNSSTSPAASAALDLTPLKAALSQHNA